MKPLYASALAILMFCTVLWSHLGFTYAIVMTSLPYSWV